MVCREFLEFSLNCVHVSFNINVMICDSVYRTGHLELRESHEWMELGMLGTTGKLEVQENRDHEMAWRVSRVKACHLATQWYPFSV